MSNTIPLGTILTFPGFLGTSSQFNPLLDCPALAKIPQFNIDLSAKHQIKESQTLLDWTTEIIDQIRSLPKPRFAFGYSMGGRIALILEEQAISDAKPIFEHIFLFASHPGLKTSIARIERKHQDQIWADCFRQKGIDAALDNWNMQEIFANDPPMESTTYSSKQAATTIMKFSLSEQNDLRRLMKQLSDRITFFVGDKDYRFKIVADELTDILPKASIHFIANKGHRLLTGDHSAIQSIVVSKIKEFAII